MKIAGVILAGGQSRRMGGTEKSLMMLAGKPPIAWVAERIRPQVETLAVNANGDPSRFSFLETKVIADTVEGFVGPLAGVLSGMRWASTLNDVTHIMTAATDTPFIPDDLVRQLSSEIGDGIAMAASNDRIHPVFGLWPVRLADDLEHFLIDEDKRKILEFANRYDLKEIGFETGGGDPFFNINTPEDLAMAERMARELQS